ncbi:MAG: NUDIX domain-containing protein [Victivallales bacterium]|nr:NUDIX domain-containing protein [Victivallales bacterium]
MNYAADELFEIVDEHNRVIGTARRAECHGNPKLLHRTSHVVVFHPDGRILLQKRAATKDIQPGKWDTAVGGHLDVGEDFEAAARREMHEELGLSPDLPLFFLFDARIRNEVESENTRVFGVTYVGPLIFPPEEIEALRYWSAEELRQPENRSRFTPNLWQELQRLRECGCL